MLYEEGRPADSLFFVVAGDFSMQKMVSLFTYQTPFNETKFVRLSYALL